MDIRSFNSFVKGLFRTEEFVPLHQPLFIGNEKSYLNKVIDSTFVSSVGEFVNEFEENFSNYTGIEESVAVVNGTSGLHLCLKVVGVQPFDEVLTQSLTFVATANAISYCGASPIFIDVDIDTMGLSPKSLLSFLNEYGEKREDGTYNKKTNRKISACVPMHTFGFMCRIDEIVQICKKWDIPVIEDAAEALGSYYKGSSAGSYGQISAFSFNGNKIITAGGGGIICSNRIDLIEKAKFLSTTAKNPHKWEYFHSEIGFNYRMPNLNAALVLSQLENLKALIENKKQLFNNYQDFFKGTNLLVHPLKQTNWNHWLFSICVESIEERNEFLKATNDSNIMTRPIWSLMFKLPMYENCQRDDQKNSLYLEQRIINIPSSARL